MGHIGFKMPGQILATPSMTLFIGEHSPKTLTVRDVTAVVFAVSGSLTAAGTGMDALGAVMVGSITALGGGTIRDGLFLGKQPFWVEEWEYLLIAIASSLATFCLWPTLPSGNAVKAADGGEGKALLVGDGIGVAAFCVIGAQNGIRAGCPALVSALCGVSTATFGGATRDVLTKQPVRIMHSEKDIYATTAFAGASAYLAARALALPLAARIAAGTSTAYAMRWAAWTYDIRLPTMAQVDKNEEGGEREHEDARE
eukprot:g2906.t1